MAFHCCPLGGMETLSTGKTWQSIAECCVNSTDLLFGQAAAAHKGEGYLILKRKLILVKLREMFKLVR